MSCINLIDELDKFIDITNLELIDNMTNQCVKYNYVCIQPNLTYDYYYKKLQKYWNDKLNQFISSPGKCHGAIGDIIEISKYISPDKIKEAKNIFDSIARTGEPSFANINLENLVLDVVATNLMSIHELSHFDLNINFVTSLVNLGKILVNQCPCQSVDIYKFFIQKYGAVYKKKLIGKDKNQVIQILREDYNKFKNFIKYLDISQIKIGQDTVYNNLANRLTGLYGFSVGSELEKLIPAELGSLKRFFIKVISKYYDNLHPIVWAQIFRAVTKNIFIDLPYTPKQLFSFFSKQLLLNSGPFILKILQTIRPILTPELAATYNLTKLTYPVLKENQIKLMLRKVVYDWNMYRILNNYSASIGHVSEVVRVDYPDSPFMIKMIKPLAVAQSCWEYKTLYDTFPVGTCEQEFIKNMLESNGRELNVQNEIINIKNGHKYYTADYDSAFSVKINAKLTSIKHIDDIIIPDCWYAMAMTIAPGVPLSKLVETDEIKNDTKYRAKLHRCLDILVYKFFQNIVRNGFYHGDLHAGNIFYSYEQSQMTLIDFGAVGHIDIYAADENTKALLDIIIMSIFHNYEELFDRMTKLLNSKCIETQIDMSSPEYATLKEELHQYHIRNIINQKKDEEWSNIYKRDIFSKQRIEEEQSGGTMDDKTIYSYLEYVPKKQETIVENRDVLPSFTQIPRKSESISFTFILEKIIKFYALSGVNIAIKFSEFYEFQKAYVLLLGVLEKVHYNPYRTGIAIGRAIKNIGNVPKLIHIRTTSHVIKTYLQQKKKSKYFKYQIETGQITI